MWIEQWNGRQATKNGGKKLDTLTHFFSSFLWKMEISHKTFLSFFLFCFCLLTRGGKGDITEISHVFLREGGVKNSLHVKLLFLLFTAEWTLFKAFCVRDFRCLHVFYYRILNPHTDILMGGPRRAVGEPFNDIFSYILVLFEARRRMFIAAFSCCPSHFTALITHFLKFERFSTV